MFKSAAHFKSENLIASKDANRFYVSELGGYLNTEWKDYIYLARENSESGTFEEYWGLWSATRKIFPNWPVDSLIHALGQTRIKAASALKNAKLIITTKESAFPDWVGWNISQSYWFYQDLIREWTPIYQSPLTTVWQKSKQNISSEEVPCQIVDRNTISILVSRPSLLEVNIQYFVSGFRSLILLDNNFSFSPVSNGFVSLDPNISNALIPIYASNKGDNIYKARFLPANRNATSKLQRCTAKLLSGDIVYGKTMTLKKNLQ
jgi:sarcosine oxidase delta subunit